MAAIELRDTPLFADPNLVAYWRLEDTSDSKGSLTLTNNGTVTFSAGQFNNAANTTATGGKYLSVNSDSLNLTNNFTVTCWVKFSSSTTNFFQGIVGRAKESGAPDVYGGWALAKENDNKFRFIMFFNNSFASAVSNSANTDTNYHHIVGVRDAGVSTIYVDGVAQTTTTSQAPDSVTNISLNIGRYYTATNNYYTEGQIDDVAIFNRALTSAEVSNLFNGNFPSQRGFMTTNTKFFGF